MKRRIFLVCLFYCFLFGLPIYESIAAIFWQSASYVFSCLHYETLSLTDLVAIDFVSPPKTNCVWNEASSKNVDNCV